MCSNHWRIMTVDIGRKRLKCQPTNFRLRTQSNTTKLVTDFSTGFEPPLPLISTSWCKVRTPCEKCESVYTAIRAMILPSELHSFLAIFEESISVGYKNSNSSFRWNLRSSCHERHDAGPRHHHLFIGRGRLPHGRTPGNLINQAKEYGASAENVSSLETRRPFRLVWLSTTMRQLAIEFRQVPCPWRIIKHNSSTIRRLESHVDLYI